MIRSKVVAVGFGLSWLMCDFAAVAQEEAMAKALFDRGIEAMQRRDFVACSDDLASSQRLIPKLVTLYHLATCEWIAGKIASADFHFQQFISGVQDLSLEKQAKQAERMDEAEKIRQALRDSIPRLTLVLPSGAPPNVQVVCDGETLTPAMIDVALPVDPGEHMVTTRVPGGQTEEHRFSIERNEKKRIVLTFDRPAELTQAKPNRAAVVAGRPPKRFPNAKANNVRTGGFVALGVGLAGLAIGGVSGLVARNDRSVVDDVCPGGICATFQDKTAGRDAWNRGAGAANVASAGLGIGVVGVAVGAVMLISSSTPEKPAPGKTAFIMGAQPGGFYFGWQGALP